ncbi:DUF4910 domain-containing protein [Pseudoalteromonas sp. SWXJZ10B]|uniref:DUF4910 domain-containing protein n=1 Tax=Pseudoalteromonas sp. SWXJZ10B TaxID=2792063 RepID=UPI0018CD3536|nr:DUF4910 domain-containing protein [Pseudoalteromonas sp. SWXJZ10B]MBH0042966.1 DUF4910 domain-containing protein [Pseudoalteromonas sp. SWXJZ10B]
MAPYVPQSKQVRTAEYALLDRTFDDLFPICRSITGVGLERSLKYFQTLMPLQIETVPSGTQVFDWTVPPSWLFKRARLWGPDGTLICDTEIQNLHVVNYSEPVDMDIEFEQLIEHLHTIADLPTAIPYVTSYYNKTWGFCLAFDEFKKLKAGTYKVLIESTFDNNGGVPFAQGVLSGESDKEILLTSYLCHPSMANNELSGPLVLLGLFNRIKNWPKRRFSYRFVLNPETIGSLCFLYKYHEHLKVNLEAGLILTCLGGPNEKMRYKASKRKNTLFDKLLDMECPNKWVTIPFSPLNGSDERQYCAPGFNLPMGQVSRTSYGNYSGYHNSLDDKEFMDINAVIASIDEIESLLIKAEYGGKVTNLCPFGEPQLGKRGLYPNLNSHLSNQKSSDSMLDGREELNAILTILSEADGTKDMADIALAMDMSLFELTSIINKLESHGLIEFNKE